MSMSNSPENGNKINCIVDLTPISHEGEVTFIGEHQPGQTERVCFFLLA